MKLYVDDVRKCPDGWLVARTVEDAKLLLMRDDVEEVSLDHDMGACADCTAKGLDTGDMKTPETTFAGLCAHALSGYDLVVWMCDNERVPATVKLHSMNPVGRKRMADKLKAWISGSEWCSRVSQLVVNLVVTQGYAGSSPAPRANISTRSSAEERTLDRRDVGGSTPSASTNITRSR